ncbi:MAG: hypothetical protein JWN04_1974 [Myxococcaceae bacterium]|nr:hypothetical protein [Myxococcaceae bacterium]
MTHALLRRRRPGRDSARAVRSALVMAGRTKLCCSVLLLLSVSACEVAADFDPNKLNADRTVGPVPLPSLDGSVVQMPDASPSPDGALIKPEQPDAEVLVDASGLDSGWADDGAVSDGASADSGNDAAAPADISFADAALK